MEMGQVGRACTSLSAAAPCNTDAARLAQRMAKRGVATAEAVWAGKELEREQGAGRRRRRREWQELRPSPVAAGAGFRHLEHAAAGASAAIAGPWVIARAGGGDAEVAEEGAQCGAGRTAVLSASCKASWRSYHYQVRAPKDRRCNGSQRTAVRRLRTSEVEVALEALHCRLRSGSNRAAAGVRAPLLSASGRARAQPKVVLCPANLLQLGGGPAGAGQQRLQQGHVTRKVALGGELPPGRG